MKTLPALFFIFLLVACEPDKVEIIEKAYTGIANNDQILISPDPIITVLAYQPDDSVSLDLNSDTKFDIKFIKKSVPLRTGFGSMTAIVTSNKLQIALSNSNNYPDSLEVNTLLNSVSTWSGSESSTYELQTYSCDQINCVSSGNFVDVNDKFIGYKLGSKYGWIKIDNSKHGELRIKEYTLIK